MARISRRKFIQSSAAASTAFGLFTIAGTKASGRVLGANDTIRVGVAGIRGRGQSHIDAFAKELKDKNVQVTYLIDPDTRLFDSRKLDGERDRRQRSASASRTFARRSTTRIWTPSPSPPAITGTR